MMNTVFEYNYREINRNVEASKKKRNKKEE
jgi:hypothetical protein